MRVSAITTANSGDALAQRSQHAPDVPARPAADVEASVYPGAIRDEICESCFVRMCAYAYAYTYVYEYVYM